MSPISLIRREVYRLSRILVLIGAAALVIMALLTGVDVCLRYVFNLPITGGYELTEFLMLLVVFLGLAYTQVKEGHIIVDLLVSRLSGRALAVTNTIATLINLGIFSVISWRLALLAKSDLARGHVSTTLGVPYYPFLFIAAFATAVFCLVFLVDLIFSLIGGRRK